MKTEQYIIKTAKTQIKAIVEMPAGLSDRVKKTALEHIACWGILGKQEVGYLGVTIKWELIKTFRIPNSRPLDIATTNWSRRIKRYRNFRSKND
jgi:hypothetical protein